MKQKIKLFEDGTIGFHDLFDSYQGWQAYARWADTYKLRREMKRSIIDAVWNRF